MIKFGVNEQPLLYHIPDTRATSMQASRDVDYRQKGDVEDIMLSRTHARAGQRDPEAPPEGGAF